MADRLFLSCWLRSAGNSRGFDREKLLRQFSKMLDRFPFSRLARRGPVVRVYAIEYSEPPQFEREFPPAADIAESVRTMIEAARDFLQQDSLCEVEASWDLWQFDGEWKLYPATVTLMCFGPGFDDATGDQLRIEFGPDSYFVPDPDIESGVRMSQSNLRSLVHLVHDLENTLDLDRRRLWSETGESPAEIIMQAVESSSTPRLD